MAYEKIEEDYTVPEQIRHREVVVARTCDKCGTREEKEPDAHYFSNPYWFPIKVEAGEAGEEGWDEADRVFCGDCASTVLSELVKLGFGTHYHGGTSQLQDDRCPGGKDSSLCPTPSSPYEDDDF